METKLIILLSAAILASGCASFNQSTEQKFKSQIQDASNSKYHVAYDVEADLQGLGGFVSGAINSPELYSTKDSSKFVVGITGMDIASYNIFSDETVVCRQGSVFGLSNSSELSCQMNQQSNSFNFEQAFENVSIEEAGTDRAAGRKCNMYTLSEKQNITEDIPQAAQQYSDGKFQICLDKKKGYPAIIKVIRNKTSELRGTGTKESVSVTAESYDTNFQDSELDIPVSIGVNVQCDPFTANITSFKYNGQATLTVNGENSQSINLEEGNTIEMGLLNKATGENKVEVTPESSSAESVTGSCYDYGFGAPDYDEYNFNETR